MAHPLLTTFRQLSTLTAMPGSASLPSEPLLLHEPADLEDPYEAKEARRARRRAKREAKEAARIAKGLPAEEDDSHRRSHVIARRVLESEGFRAVGGLSVRSIEGDVKPLDVPPAGFEPSAWRLEPVRSGKKLCWKRCALPEGSEALGLPAVEASGGSSMVGCMNGLQLLLAKLGWGAAGPSPPPSPSLPVLITSRYGCWLWGGGGSLAEGGGRSWLLIDAATSVGRMHRLRRGDEFRIGRVVLRVSALLTGGGGGSGTATGAGVDGLHGVEVVSTGGARQPSRQPRATVRFGGRTVLEEGGGAVVPLAADPVPEGALRRRRSRCAPPVHAVELQVRQAHTCSSRTAAALPASATSFASHAPSCSSSPACAPTTPRLSNIVTVIVS